MQHSGIIGVAYWDVYTAAGYFSAALGLGKPDALYCSDLSLGDIDCMLFLCSADTKRFCSL